MRRMALILLAHSLVLNAATPPPTLSALPGIDYAPPARPTAPGAPLVYEHTQEAGPDQSFLLIGEKLSTNVVVWGNSSEQPGGQEWRAKVQFLTNGVLAATLPENANDGPFLVWIKNEAGFSLPLVLNAPQPWWCYPAKAEPGAIVRVFGRSLARRPDSARAFVCVGQSGQAPVWAEVVAADRFAVSFRVPKDFKPGASEVWVHAGNGGAYGWGGPVPLEVVAADRKSVSSTSAGSARSARRLPAGAAKGELQKALDEMEKAGGGLLNLDAGTYEFSGTLRVPGGVELSGAETAKTILQAVQDRTGKPPRLTRSDWNQSPVGIQTAGDSMEYDIRVPQAGTWSVWMRYAAEIPASKPEGLDGCMTLETSGQSPVPLTAVTNTGSYGNYKWTKAGEMNLAAGSQKLIWRNVKGGGIAIDAFVLALRPKYQPSDLGLPRSGRTVMVVQAEDCGKFASRAGQLPARERPAVWLAGDAAALRNVTVLGNAQLNIGVLISGLQATQWLSDCVLERVRVADCDRKEGEENCGVLARRVRHASVADNVLQGRAPLIFEGARGSAFLRNQLVSVTRYGNNAGAAMTGRSDVLEDCVIENNRVMSPPGAPAGSPAARRFLWVSTGRGSVRHNWIAGNGPEQLAPSQAGDPRFAGVPGYEQNVGEMILFIAHHRMAYHGPLAAASEQSVTLPETIEPTPDARLGHLKRIQLSQDDEDRETPFFPPLAEDGTDEPASDQYYVTILAGRGQGQSRRVARREGPRLILERPWTVAPEAGSTVAVATAFHQNLIVGNHAGDGMTGVELWISCFENVIANNTMGRLRRAGYFLFGNATTLASSMPRTWDRGLSPCYWNLVEGNVSDEANAGIDLASENAGGLPILFPRLLGNVIRHNSFLRNRSEGVYLMGDLYRPRTNANKADTSPALRGTLVEFNFVREAEVAFRVGLSCDTTLFRRNLTYFWNAADTTNAPVAFQIDDPTATVRYEHNVFEGPDGGALKRLIGIKHPNRVEPLP